MAKAKTKAKPCALKVEKEKPATFGLLDFVVHSNRIKIAEAVGQKAACWMVTREELREQGRRQALKEFNDGLLAHGIVKEPLTAEEFEPFVLRMAPTTKAAWEGWVKYEMELAALRAAGNPRAFFVG